MEFVNDKVGELVPDHASNTDFANALAEAVFRALTQDWKRTKGDTAISAASGYTLVAQCERVLAAATA